MAEEPKDEPITEQDISAFAEKLEKWASSLEEKERNLLYEMVRYTRIGDETEADVEAYALRNFREATIFALNPLRAGVFAGTPRFPQLGRAGRLKPEDLPDKLDWMQWAQRQY
jgi:hypothetical protein